MIALPYAARLQSLGKTAHHGGHFGIAELAAHEIGQRRLAHPFSRPEKHVMDRKRRKGLFPFSGMEIVGNPGTGSAHRAPLCSSITPATAGGVRLIEATLIP